MAAGNKNEMLVSKPMMIKNKLKAPNPSDIPAKLFSDFVVTSRVYSPSENRKSRSKGIHNKVEG